MSSYPRALSYFVNRVSNFSKNGVKLLPYRTDAVSAGQIICLDLPANSLVDLRTLAMKFKMTTTASGGTNNFATAPQNIESIIDRVSVEINGQTLHACANLNYVYNALLPLMGGTDMKNKRKVYQNAGDVADPTANLTAEPFCIQHWLGFIGSVSPDVLDTSLLGNVRINISLASGNVLVKAGTTGPTSATYTLDDLYFTVDTLSIDDGTFYPLHQQALNGGMVYELPFDCWYTSLFSAQTMNQSSRFSVSTQSLDAIFATFPTNYNTLSAVNSVSGRGAAFDTVGTGLTSYKVTVNNVAFPQYTAGIDDSFPNMLNTIHATHDVSNGISDKISKDSWKSAFCVFGQSFELGADSTERVISGLNTLGSSAQVSFESTGTTEVGYCMIIAKCSSTLRCSSGRNIEIVL